MTSHSPAVKTGNVCARSLASFQMAKNWLAYK